MTIGFRLTLWNTVVIGVVTTVMAVSVYCLSAWNLDRNVDEVLVERAAKFHRIWSSLPNGDRVVIRAREGPPIADVKPFIDDTRRKEMEAEMEFMVPRFFDPSDRANWDKPAWDARTVPGAPLGKRPLITSVTNLGRHVRVASFQVVDGSQHAMTIQFAEPLAAVDDEKRRLAMLLCLLVPISWLLAALAGHWLTRRALEPVRSIIRAADTLTPENLSHRLPATGHDEMSSLAGIINRFLDRSEQSYRRLETFVADASHELKSPLTTILLRSSSRRDPSPDMEAVHRSALAMRRTVDDLLLVARMDKGGVADAQMVDLGRLAGEVADDHVSVLGERLVLDADPGVVVQGTESLLRRLVGNLVENASTHAGPEATVRVTVRQVGVEAVISVVDDGVGIPPEHLPHVFDRFYRADRARTHHDDWQGEGSGLGLAIVQTIVQAHHGSVVLKSEVCQGTEVTVWLPLSTAT